MALPPIALLAADRDILVPPHLRTEGAASILIGKSLTKQALRILVTKSQKEKHETGMRSLYV